MINIAIANDVEEDEDEDVTSIKIVREQVVVIRIVRSLICCNNCLLKDITPFQ